MPKRRTQKPARNPIQRLGQPDDESLVRRLVDLIRTLDGVDQFMLAATVDWIRQAWRGDSEVLDDPECEDKAWQWIRARRTSLLTDSVTHATREALRAAVTS